MSAFVTDGNQRSSLAVVRALGREGIAVTVGESTSHSLAGSSRYCHGAIRYPSPTEDARGFRDFLLGEMRSGRYRVLIPMTDVTTQLVGQLGETLRQWVSVPLPSAEVIMRVQDKRYTLQRARKLGIPCPQTYMVEEDESLEFVAQSAHYPVVIKPRFSRYVRDGEWEAGSVKYARDGEALLKEFAAIHARIPAPLVQEKLEGEGRGVFLLVWNGELKAAFCHRRLREKPPWGGVSVYCESLPLDQNLVQKSLALLNALDWQGVAMVEFKVDPRDGQAKLMEVNGRFWGSLQLAIDAGANFPLLLYRLATGQPVAPQLDHRLGVRSRWLLGDLDHLLIRLVRSSSPDGSAYSAASRLRTFLAFMNFWESKTRNEVFRFDDRGPGWFEIKSYLRDNFLRSKSGWEESRGH